jgi:hypothetical protein
MVRELKYKDITEKSLGLHLRYISFSEMGFKR